MRKLILYTAAILAFLLLVVSFALGQPIGSPLGTYNIKIVTAEEKHTPPDNSQDFAWNNAPYFRSPDYLNSPDKRFFDWSNYVTTWDGKQAAVWGLFALSGVAHGIREAYHADPYIFERRNGVAPTSFWGSDAWKRNYIDNDPDKPHKHEMYGNVGRDVWHTFNQVDLIPLGTACITMGARRHPVKYKVANTIVGIGLRVLFANITYATLRNTR
jgi:hypothetical protein